MRRASLLNKIAQVYHSRRDGVKDPRDVQSGGDTLAAAFYGILDWKYFFFAHAIQLPECSLSATKGSPTMQKLALTGHSSLG